MATRVTTKTFLLGEEDKRQILFLVKLVNGITKRVFMENSSLTCCGVKQ